MKSNSKLFLFCLLIALMGIAAFFVFFKQSGHHRPLIAIANYGPHTSLQASIEGLKDELAKEGFIENKTVDYVIEDAGFDPTLIPQMITHLKNEHPKVMVVLTTPVAQFAKHEIKDLPLVFTAVTDPVEAGLLNHADQSLENVTGASDKQDLDVLLNFAKQLLPQASRVGILYATGEANDAALVKMMVQATVKNHFKMVAIPIDQSRDIPIRMQAFKDRVDFIYVGTSGPIQPALPVIAAEAAKMHIPVFNADSEAVKQDLVLASFGVDYLKVGANTGKLVAQILKGASIESLTPIYPASADHHGFVSQKQAAQQGLILPSTLKNASLVD